METVSAIGILAAVLSGIYAAAAFAVGVRTRAAGPPRQGADGGDRLPRISVVVAARNEERALPACLAALERVDYPADRWEVVVVDDRSTDRTAQLARSVAERWPIVRLVQVTECPTGLGGKQHALAVGIARTTGDLIATTDADCIVPRGWLRGMATAFAPEVGAVAGYVTFPSPRSVWHRLQRAELAHLAAASWSLSERGLPMTAMGGNLAVRRAAYEQVGGYAALGYTVAEDCALVQALVSAKRHDSADGARWRMAAAPPSATVLTEPLPDVGSFVRQRVRWATGAYRLTVPQFLLLAAVLLQRLATLSATALWLAGLLDGRWPALAWGCAMVGDAVLMVRAARVLGLPRIVLWSPLVTLWQALYQPLVGLWAAVTPRRAASPEPGRGNLSG